MRWINVAILSIVLSGCMVADDSVSPYAELYRLYDYPQTLTRAQVPVCFHHGCASVEHVAINEAQWQQVSRHLNEPAADARAEREQVRRAIAEMERVTGELAGTSGDIAGDLGSFGTLDPQMDCIDESANTTTYLTLFEQAGLLRYHHVASRANRGMIFYGGMPHYSAMLTENATGRQWVIDSWFRDNGEPPDVVDLQTWKDGWKPDGFTF